MDIESLKGHLVLSSENILGRKCDAAVMQEELFRYNPIVEKHLCRFQILLIIDGIDTQFCGCITLACDFPENEIEGVLRDRVVISARKYAEEKIREAEKREKK